MSNATSWTILSTKSNATSTLLPFGNNIEQVFREISSSRQSRNKLNMFFVEIIVRLVVYDNVASTLSLVWTGLYSELNGWSLTMIFLQSVNCRLADYSKTLIFYKTISYLLSSQVHKLNSEGHERYSDEHETFKLDTDTRPRRDVCRSPSRDVNETLK